MRGISSQHAAQPQPPPAQAVCTSAPPADHASPPPLPHDAPQDHKRAHEGDKGPNTGGMGTYSGPNGTLPFLSQVRARLRARARAFGARRHERAGGTWGALLAQAVHDRQSKAEAPSAGHRLLPPRRRARPPRPRTPAHARARPSAPVRCAILRAQADLAHAQAINESVGRALRRTCGEPYKVRAMGHSSVLLVCVRLWVRRVSVRRVSGCLCAFVGVSWL